MSLPLTGPQGRLGRELLRGAELAHERAGAAVELFGLDSHEDGAAVNAERAAADAPALAYLGDARSADVLQSAPVLGAAGLLAVAPVATYAGLAGPTLVRLMPHDGVGARAIAAWLREQGVRELVIVHDHDEGYGVPVGAMCAEAARACGLGVRARPIADDGSEDADGAQALLYVGVAGSGVVALWQELHARDPRLWLLGSDGIAVDWLARELSPSAAARTRFFVAQRAPWGFYGYEAMALILDALTDADDRASVVARARATRDRESVIGRYSIDPDGLTSTTAYGRLAVADGQLAWDRG